jgi:hypothetical protein
VSNLLGYNAAWSIEYQPVSEEHVASIFRVEAELANCFLLVSCFAYSSTLNMYATCSPKHQLIFNGLHGVISQKMKFFIITPERTSDPALLFYN